MIEPRIILRDILGPVLSVPKAKPGELTCTRTIKLDGRMYRCGREVSLHDRQHDGIHDAFCEHGGGAVRW